MSRAGKLLVTWGFLRPPSDTERLKKKKKDIHSFWSRTYQLRKIKRPEERRGRKHSQIYTCRHVHSYPCPRPSVSCSLPPLPTLPPRFWDAKSPCLPCCSGVSPSLSLQFAHSTLQRRTGNFDSDISTYGLPEGRGMASFLYMTNSPRTQP